MRSPSLTFAYGCNPAAHIQEHVRRVAAANGLGVAASNTGNLYAHYLRASDEVYWDSGMTDEELLAQHVSTMLLLIKSNDAAKVYTPAKNAAHYARRLLQFAEEERAAIKHRKFNFDTARGLRY